MPSSIMDSTNDNDGGAVGEAVAAAAAAAGVGGDDDISFPPGGLDVAVATAEDDDVDDDAPPTKRARVDDNAAVDNEVENDPALLGPFPDVQQAVLKYKQKRGTVYDITFGEEDSSGQQGTDSPFGIKLITVKVKHAHSLIPHYYQMARGEQYRGRPPSASDQAIIVVNTDAAQDKTKSTVQRNDILIFINDKLVNITDKKRLKYFRARLNNGARPLKLTFFRPSEGEEHDEPDDDGEEVELAPSEGLYVTKYEPAECPTPASASTATTSKSKAAKGTKDDRSARRALLERRLEELEILHVETSTELSELRAQDGVLDGSLSKASEGEKLNVRGDEDFVIPAHILYYPPMKLRRKKMPALNVACNKVENLLRQRMLIDNEAEKVRGVVKQAQMRLDLKNKELKALDEKMTPALEDVKLLEMEVHDNWKTMYLKLKDYYEQHGHTNVMEKEDTKLAKWITRQRTMYANAQQDDPNPSLGIIKPYQYDLLNRITFCWNPREQQFIQNVAMLRRYKEEHGHTNVPMKCENLHLANFVQKWRREYRLFQEGKPSNMSQDRLQVLEQAGFSWRDPSRSRKRSDTRQETWDGFISQLHEFKQKYGHFMVNKVNKTLEKGNRLGRLDEFCGWVRKQYVLYKEGSPCQLTEEKVNQLIQMGFWLERGQAQKFAAANSPQKEPAAAVQLQGELKVPHIDEFDNSNLKTGEDNADGTNAMGTDGITMV